MEGAEEALQVISSLCDGALVEAKDVMTSLKSSAQAESSDELSISPIIRKPSVSRSFTSAKGRVFISEDKKFKLVAYECDGKLPLAKTSTTSIKKEETVAAVEDNQRLGHEQEFIHNGLVYKLKINALIGRTGLKNIEINDVKAHF